MHCKDKTMHYLLLVQFHLYGRSSFTMHFNCAGIFFNSPPLVTLGYKPLNLITPSGFFLWIIFVSCFFFSQECELFL